MEIKKNHCAIFSKIVNIFLSMISCHFNKAKVKHTVVVVQSLSHVLLFETPGSVAHQASLSFTVSQGLLKSISISSSAALFSFCLQSFPASESFPMSRLHKQSQSLQFLSFPEGLQIQKSSLTVPQIPSPSIKLPTEFSCSNVCRTSKPYIYKNCFILPPKYLFILLHCIFSE